MSELEKVAKLAKASSDIIDIFKTHGLTPMEAFQVIVLIGEGLQIKIEQAEQGSTVN